MTAAPMWDGSEVRGILGMPPAGKLSIRLQLHVTTSKANKITLVSVKVAFSCCESQTWVLGQKGEDHAMDEGPGSPSFFLKQGDAARCFADTGLRDCLGLKSPLLSQR